MLTSEWQEDCVALLQHSPSNPAERLEEVTHFKQPNDQQLQRLT